MILLGKELVFWDKNQISVCRWLDEDQRKFGKISYLQKTLTDTKSLELIRLYNWLKEDKDYTNDKYIKALIQAKMDGVIEDLVAPIMEARKKYYEDYFNYALEEKRIAMKENIKRWLIKKWMYNPDKEIILSF